VFAGTKTVIFCRLGATYIDFYISKLFFRMRGTKIRVSRYWDKIILQHIPPYAKFSKFESEIKEHFTFVSWMTKRIVVPLATFYIVLGMIFGMNVLGSLFISLLVFFYSNFLPDLDSLIKKPPKGRKDSQLTKRYFLLFFAPISLYYIIGGRTEPLYFSREKSFHNSKTMFVYAAFLFIIGFIIWTNLFKAIVLMLFGILGFGFHLAVDKRFKIKLVQKVFERIN